MAGLWVETKEGVEEDNRRMCRIRGLRIKRKTRKWLPIFPQRPEPLLPPKSHKKLVWDHQYLQMRVLPLPITGQDQAFSFLSLLPPNQGQALVTKYQQMFAY